MNLIERVMAFGLASMFLVLCYCSISNIFEWQKKKINIQRIQLKIQMVQDAIDDLKDFSKNLQIKNSVAHIQYDTSPDLVLMDRSFKTVVIAEVIDIKTDMMIKALADALKELQD